MFDKIVRHGTLMTVVVLIITLLGVLAALRIPVQMIPDLEVRTISVVTSWPGATPQDVEKEILIEQEEYLRNLPNLRRMTSSAGSGEAEIELEFPFVDRLDVRIVFDDAVTQRRARRARDADLEPLLLDDLGSPKELFLLLVGPFREVRAWLNTLWRRRCDHGGN